MALRVSNRLINTLGPALPMRNATCNQRSAHSHSIAKKVLVIPAANSKISQGTISEALKNGYHIIALTSDKQKSMKIYKNTLQDTRFQVVEIGCQDYSNFDSIKQCVKEALQGKLFDQVAVVNTLGGTKSTVGAPDKENTLKVKNIDMPLGFIQGTLQATKDSAGTQSVVHISSIAASISSSVCTYAKIRRTAETRITDSVQGSQVNKVTHLRVGLVQSDIEIGKDRTPYLNSGHNHSSENWRGYPLVAVGGHDDVAVHSPVNLKDVAEGALAAAHRDFGPDHWIVDGVSKQLMTQRDYLTYFTKNKNVLCVHMPLEVLHKMTQIVADGRLQPYAIHIIEALQNNPQILDSEAFETLLGRPAKTLCDMYSNIEEFQSEGPELLTYIKELLREARANPSQLVDLAKTAIAADAWKLSLIKK